MVACEVLASMASPSNNGPPKRRRTGDGISSFEYLNDEICHTNEDHEVSAAGQDALNYSLAWFIYHKRREHLFKPWSSSLGQLNSQLETLRLQAINTYWRTVKMNRINPVTIHLAVWLMNRLLSATPTSEMSREKFAGTVAVAFRTALKFEERPEALWSIRRIWEVLPLFDTWNIDRSDQYLMKIEAEALRLLDDCLDAPLSVQFFDKYITVGGWPAEVAREYTYLGHFLLGLATFAGGENHPLINIPPSKLAAAAVVLAVKIVNGDSKKVYEFYPERFAAFCREPIKELHPAIKGLSYMLRKKPDEAAILGRVYPDWGEHEWQ